MDLALHPLALFGLCLASLFVFVDFHLVSRFGLILMPPKSFNFKFFLSFNEVDDPGRKGVAPFVLTSLGYKQ